MSKMDKYTILCRPEQTKRAYELGAPIEVVPSYPTCSVLSNTIMIDYDLVHIPTAEQMRGWLEHVHGISVEVTKECRDFECGAWYYNAPLRKFENIYDGIHESRKEAALAAIDAALDYLEKGGNNDD